MLDSGGGGMFLEIIMLLFLSGSEWLWCTIHDLLLLVAYYGDIESLEWCVKKIK